MKKSVPSFIKWAGGKKQLLEQFEPFFPKKIDTYVEPFVGGGAVLFYILINFKPKQVTIMDINPELINTYTVIRDDVENLINELKKLRKLHNKEHYLQIRAENPELLSPLTRAARFIYLNKTCFNGLYRVNSKGGFNVPMGDYKNPSIFSEEDLKQISKLLKNVEMKLESFERCVKYTKKGAFVYFDPPYYPLKRESFTTYTKEKFLEDEQRLLKKTFATLDKKGCKVMLSNSDTDFIKDLYKDYSEKIHFVRASRMINSKASGRGKINEIVVTNY